MLNTIIAVIKVITVHIKRVDFINQSSRLPCESQGDTAGGSEDELQSGGKYIQQQHIQYTLYSD